MSTMLLSATPSISDSAVAQIELPVDEIREVSISGYIHV